MIEPFYEDKYRAIYHADCRDVLPQIQGVTAVVTDPPYELKFMGKKWDGTGISFQPETWALVRASCLLGAPLLSFGGTRTFHRIACALEDAGWELRDTICWVFGSGFPKALDISKAVDKVLGAERTVVGILDPRGVYDGRERHSGAVNTNWRKAEGRGDVRDNSKQVVSAPATPEAKLWNGWGSCLKPAWESITWAVNPLPGDAECGIITASLCKLEAQLWSLLSVDTAESRFGLSRADHGKVCVIAQFNAAQVLGIREGLLARMDTSQFVGVMTTCLSTVQSWRRIWEDVSPAGSTFIIGMGLNATTGLRTLSYLLLQTTPESLIQDVISAGGGRQLASPVARFFSAVSESLNATRIISALESAISPEVAGSLARVEPRVEPILLGMNPLDKTYANNALTHGVAGLNIDECRVPLNGEQLSFEHTETTGAVRRGYPRGSGERHGADREDVVATERRGTWMNSVGRYPANFIHDNSDEVRALFPSSKGQQGDVSGDEPSSPAKNVYGDYGRVPFGKRNDNGNLSTARFFYSPKASRSERGEGNSHATVKPLSLIEYLCKLVRMPQRNLVLDPFVGSGTTLLACAHLGIQSIGIDSDESSCEIAAARCAADAVRMLEEGTY